MIKIKNLVKAKKHLGQHFLINTQVADKIVLAFSEKQKNFFTIEIGAGTGVLTKRLLPLFNKNNFIAIDIDSESIEFLKKEYPEHREQFLLEDFLHSKLIEHLLLSQKVNIIGNFPYNISSQIMFKVLEHRKNIEVVTGMFQKEVAERICAVPGNKNYGILSVLLQTFFHTKYLFTVHEGSFNPPPKVKSGVIMLETKGIKDFETDENLFFDIVKTSFQQRRKTLRNSLKKWFSVNINLPYGDKRPEQLSYKEFIEITSLIQD